MAAAAALVLGGVGGWMAASMRPVEPAIAPPAPALTSVPADVAGTAEMFTNLYLSGTASPTDLSTMYTGDAPPPSATWVNSSRTMSGEILGDDVWGITVLVDALEPVDGEYQPVPLRYFLVPISTASGRPIAIGAPAHIPAPAAAVVNDAFTGPVAADQAIAATTFVERYLTGGDDIARYLSATARIPIFARAPYVAAVATPSGADGQDRVRIVVNATNQLGIVHDLEYIVTLTFDGGVWEIADLIDGSQ